MTQGILEFLRINLEFLGLKIPTHPQKSQKILRNFISVFLSIFKHYRFSSFVVWSIASLVVIAFEFAS